MRHKGATFNYTRWRTRCWTTGIALLIHLYIKWNFLSLTKDCFGWKWVIQMVSLKETFNWGPRELCASYLCWWLSFRHKYYLTHWKTCTQKKMSWLSESWHFISSIEVTDTDRIAMNIFNMEIPVLLRVIGTLLQGKNTDKKSSPLAVVHVYRQSGQIWTFILDPFLKHKRTQIGSNRNKLLSN